eukprot:m.140429 g.140429  ORF g.140429 m.140429 type:complete len:385 (-) comp30113_c0_seq1:86-1240(-)
MDPGADKGTKPPAMSSKNAKKNRKRKRKAAALSSSASTSTVISPTCVDANFPMEKQLRFSLMACGCPGCHIVDKDCPWIFSERKAVSKPPLNNPYEALQDEDDDDNVEIELVKDGDTGVLGVSNHSNVRKAIYLSTQAMDVLPATFDLFDKYKNKLFIGSTTDENKETCACATFIIILDAHRAMDLAMLDVGCLESVGFSKLSFELKPHPDPECAAVRKFKQFPLGGQGPYLCTQGIGGRLTHFFPESFHAFDLRCPEGTPVLALADGKVVEITQESKISGVHCDNLTEWNSVSIEISGSILIEYVHISPHTCSLKVGDSVKAGQELCKSGNVGFTPEAHVHIEAHNSKDPKGPSVKIELVDSSGKAYVPEAGKIYSKEGEHTQ